jgi:hypothetical protein
METGALKSQVRAALLDAFRKPNEMKIVVSNAGLPKSFDNFLAVEGTTYEAALFNLLEWVESQDALVRFLKAAQAENRGNPELKKVMASLTGLEAKFTALRPDKPLEEAESIVLHGVRFENVGPWLDTLGSMRRAVCRIEPQPQVPGDSSSLAGYGTGYLVASDVVMTNFHVVSSFWSDPAKAKQVKVRFDYEVLAAGGNPAAGTAHNLAMDWSNARFKGDPRQHPWQCPASPAGELDFALLRLGSPAGDESVGGVTRGFLKLTSRGFSESDPLMILQHPAAEPLMLSFGAVEDLDPPSRVRYKVNTVGGLSGSPCLTQDLKVTAIHHYGLVDKNRGVTHKAILNHLVSIRDRLEMLGLEHLLA